MVLNGLMQNNESPNAKHTRIAMLRNGWTESHDESAACPHRDATVCPSCADEYSDILIGAYGEFWIMPTVEDALLAEAEFFSHDL
jgi:hypothetical protein